MRQPPAPRATPPEPGQPPSDQIMLDVIIKRFEQPDEIREMVKGRFGATRCTVEHLGLVLAGVATVAFEDRVVRSTSSAPTSMPVKPLITYPGGINPALND
jgi:hypothetical protein